MSLEFQIYDWIEDHEIEENESESEEGEKDMIGSYIIHTFGRNIDGKSVYMKIVNYTPHFYIKLPLNWNKMDASINVKKMYTYLISDSNKKIWKKYRSSLQSMDIVERMDAEGFTDEKTFLFARLIFTNSIGMSKYRYMFEGSTLYIPGVTVKSMSFKLYEANILAMLRCFHIRKVSGCSWIKIDTYKIVERAEDKESYCDIEIRVDWRNIIPITKNVNAPFRIMSFDIECYSCDNNFPQAIRSTDCITMIGSTYTMLGEASPYRQHIVCLKDTDNVEGVIVESYKSEAEMLLGWIDEIRKNDCDILTGYNIFFFDENYIYERCMLLNLTHDIMRISKLKNFECKFRDFNLASSALGENRIRMFNTPGRIHIDLMKDVQKNHKLSCYKLDFVASSFIRDTINYINFENNTMELKCNGINDICIGDFIHIEYALDFISDMIGGKYNVTSINKINKTMIIEGDLSNLNEFINKSEYMEWVDMNKNDRKFKLWWCQAKDDMEVKDIFRSYKGSSYDRGVVAKYCIKDCKLVGLLMDKLNVVTNNIEMSNVCYVPMSFLFTRGQTIKLFSLVLKEFRENGYLFPVLKKPDIKIPSYEGAIVFDPEPTVDYEALAVNDYASLYPSSIIEMNMSIETKVKLDSYDNIPNILYHSADFRDHDGTIQHRRFAMKNNKLGVIPTILTNLLNERAVVKKIMKTEKNFFTAKILDGKQLALKVTANSLYGALGAETSPILDRDIAACTTSIGRKRLILAKNFVENIVPQFFNGLRIAWNEGDNMKADKLISMEVKKNDIKLIERLKKFITKDIADYTYQPIVRYGDSVIGSTPLLLRNTNTGMIFIDSIENLKCNFVLMDRKNSVDQDKEAGETYNIESWTESGWTRIHRVIRHKLDSSKKLFRITTHSGSVVVTDDHSLLNTNGTPISMKDVKIGTKLLHSFPEIKNNIVYTFYNGVTLNTEIAMFLGSIIFNNIINENHIIIDKYFKLNKNDFIKEINNTMFRTDEGTYIVPNFILNSVKEIREAFLSGMYYINQFEIKEYHIANKLQCQSIYTLCKSLDYDIYIHNNDMLVIGNKYIDDNINTIKKIEEWDKEKEEYVYDLTTDNHHFHAGVGSLIVHNTDSIFTCYRFRENTKRIKNDDAMILWKEIIKFSKKLLIQFLPEEHHMMWNSLHETYYGEINELSVPSTLVCKELSTHYKNISPIKDRMEQFMLQYMEGMMLSWLWTLQDIITKEYVDIKIKDEMIEDKLFKTGYNMVESMKIIPRDIMDEDKISIIHMVESFIKHKLKNYIVTPYWDIVEEKRITKIIVYKNGTKIIDKRALINTIEIGILAGDFIKNYLPFPHDCKYEKTFWPFLILSKKRYVGNKYEEDPNKYKQDFNGIVLKRRDNAPIVKEICGGIINYLINEKDPLKAKIFTIDCMRKMFNNMYNIKYFQTSKTLKPKESYKCKNCKRSCPRAIEQGIIMNTIEEYNRWDMNYKNSKEEIRLRIKENNVKCTCNDACPKAIEIDRLELLTSINKINGKIEKIPKNEEICTCEAWKKFAHCVLAERIALRNPGDSPQSGDRIEFAVVKIPNLTKTTLQGERIETPEYIKTNNLVLDYEFYMTNQIMKPALQFLELVIPNAKNIFDEFKLKIENNKKNRANILDFCKKIDTVIEM